MPQSVSPGLRELGIVASDVLDEALGVLAADEDVERVRVAPGFSSMDG